MTIHFLQNIFEKSINGEWGNEDSGKGESTAVIRTSNFLNSGRLNLDNIVCRDIDKIKYSDKILRTGDIIIEKSGGSPNQPVGRVVYFDVTDQDYFTNNFTSILRVKPGYNSKYIFYLMKYFYDTKKVLKFQNQTTGIINLKLADYLNKTKVNIETIENQNTIVDILDWLEYQIINRNKQLSELSNLVKSRFNEMFGDISKFDVERLNNSVKEMFIGPFGSSLKNDYFVSKEKAYCMVYEQKHAIKKTMNLETRYVDEKKYKELKRFSIYGGDIIVSCRGTIGEIFQVPNNAPLGIMHPSIMKIRLDNSKYNPIFFKFMLSDYMDIEKIKSKGSGVKMAITASELGKIGFPLPPLSLQNEYADFVAQVDKSQFACQKAIKLWRNSLKSSII